MKQLQYRIEAFFAGLLFRAFRLLPLDISSAIGAIIGRAIGPFFSATKIAKQNLAMAFPDYSKVEIDRIVGKMWAHLGRIGAEYSSLPGRRMDSRIEVIGEENILKSGQAAFLFTGHIGNWEVCYRAFKARGLNMSIVYRHVNNPYIDRMIRNFRQAHSNELIPKGMRGGIKILSSIKRGDITTMLIDQKTNNGIAVPFFGRDAMTSPAIAEIALKYNVPLIPVRVIRTKGAHFKCIHYPAIMLEKTDNHKQDVYNAMLRLHGILESWIREYPEQWFWVHRRWPKEPRA